MTSTFEIAMDEVHRISDAAKEVIEKEIKESPLFNSSKITDNKEWEEDWNDFVEDLLISFLDEDGDRS